MKVIVRKTTIALSCALLGLCFSSAVFAGRITVADTGALSSAGANTTNTQGFTLDQAYEDVEVTIRVGAFNATSGAEVYLSTQVGPGTNASHVIAQTLLPATPSNVVVPQTDRIVFDGLSLGAGQYFVSLGLNSGYTWTLAPRPELSPIGTFTGRGAASFLGGAANITFAPASSFTFFTDFTHRVLVTASEVPEPSSLALLVLSLCFALVIAPKRRVRGVY